jgi:hypothetical protein
VPEGAEGYVKRQLKVTFQYLDNHVAVHEADSFTTEGVQWRVDQDADILLIPMVNVRSVRVEGSTRGGVSNGLR